MMPSPIKNDRRNDDFGEKGSEAYSLYLQIRKLGQKVPAQEILSDNKMTTEQKIEALRNLIGKLKQ